jgi:hypothetical protein
MNSGTLTPQLTAEVRREIDCEKHKKNSRHKYQTLHAVCCVMTELSIIALGGKKTSIDLKASSPYTQTLILDFA